MQFGVDIVEDGVLFPASNAVLPADDAPHRGIDVGFDAADAVGGRDIGDNRVVLAAYRQRLEQQDRIDRAHQEDHKAQRKQDLRPDGQVSCHASPVDCARCTWKRNSFGDSPVLFLKTRLK